MCIMLVWKKILLSTYGVCAKYSPVSYHISCVQLSFYVLCGPETSVFIAYLGLSSQLPNTHQYSNAETRKSPVPEMRKSPVSEKYYSSSTTNMFKRGKVEPPSTTKAKKVVRSKKRVPHSRNSKRSGYSKPTTDESNVHVYNTMTTYKNCLTGISKK